MELGWGLSKNRNGMLWFPKNGGGIGTIFWHVNGRVRLFLHEGYVTDGHAKQLFSDGFGDLIEDNRVLLVCLSTVRHVRGDFTAKTQKRLPHAEVDEFKESHGISIKLGDRSHPQSVEVRYEIPSCLKPFEVILEKFYVTQVSRSWECREKESRNEFYVV